MKNIKDTNEKLKLEKDGIAEKVKEAVREAEDQKRYLTVSVNKMLTEMNKFAEGDLTVRLESEKDDEIGKLYKGFSKAVVNIKNLIREVAESSKTAVDSSTEISHSTEEMAAGSQEQSSPQTPWPMLPQLVMQNCSK